VEELDAVVGFMASDSLLRSFPFLEEGARSARKTLEPQP
jgi:hypothetical protein